MFTKEQFQRYKKRILNSQNHFLKSIESLKHGLMRQSGAGYCLNTLICSGLFRIRAMINENTEIQ